MVQVKKDLCRGCGKCVNQCPVEAISMQRNVAVIDQSLCNQCGICVDFCPCGAISMVKPVNADELRQSVVSLKQRTEDILERIDSLK